MASVQRAVTHSLPDIVKERPYEGTSACTDWSVCVCFSGLALPRPLFMFTHIL